MLSAAAGLISGAGLASVDSTALAAAEAAADAAMSGEAGVSSDDLLQAIVAKNIGTKARTRNLRITFSFVLLRGPKRTGFQTAVRILKVRADFKRAPVKTLRGCAYRFASVAARAARKKFAPFVPMCDTDSVKAAWCSVNGEAMRMAVVQNFTFQKEKSSRRVVEPDLDMNRLAERSSPAGRIFEWLRWLMPLSRSVIGPPRRSVERELEETWPSNER